MRSLVPITRDQHGTKRWRRYTSYEFAARMPLVPIVSAELPVAVHAMPLAFAKEDDHFTLVAVLSPIPGRNLSVGPKGEWLGAYIPAMFRGYPFRLLLQERTGEHLLGVDESSGLVPDDGSGDEPFFNEHGEPSDAIKGILGFLHQIETSRALTVRATAALADSGLLKPWPLKVEAGNGPQSVDGLFHIDELAMSELSDNAFGSLRKMGALPIAYGQLFSMTNVNVFSQLAQIQAQLAPKPVTPESVLKNFDSVDPFFGLSAHDNLIKF